MTDRKLIGLAVATLAAVAFIAYAAGQAAKPPTPEQAAKLMKDGNWKEAFEAFSRLVLEPAIDADHAKLPEYFSNAVQCARRLNSFDEMDEFREKAIAAHPKHWRLLQAAANSLRDGPHHGYIVAGQFHRGWARGGRVRYANSYERDRVRSLQLMQQAMEATADEADKNAVGQFYIDFSLMLNSAHRNFTEAWRLQYLTDLTTLPDYDEGGYGYGGYTHGHRGAPVDAEGNPVYHYTPKSWQTAETDGQRWRWCLSQAMEYAPGRTGYVKFLFASFLHHQFGVQTMREYGWFFGRAPAKDDDTQTDESGTWAMHTLSDEETIAKLASGIKRFKLPDEFNFIKIFRDIADNRSYDFQSRETLARIYENRRQYPKAADEWRTAIKEYGEGHNAYRQKALAQIVEPWGMFEPIMTQPAAKNFPADYADDADKGKDKEEKSVKSAKSADEFGATVDFRFRNGNKVSFTAQAIDVAKLLADVKAYIKSNPPRLDWQQVNIGDIGYRLVTSDEGKYHTGEPIKWDLALKPRPNHVDARITVRTPLKTAGAYLLTGRLENGNVSRVVLWVADTAIVRKPLENATLFFVADARDGAPVAKANIEFFGYHQQWSGGNAGRYNTTTRNFAEFADDNGMFTAKGDLLARDHQWVIIATTPADGKQPARLAYLGFTGIWHSGRHDPEYNQTKVFVITDRPVYRPNSPVKFKFWVNTAKYDLDGKSEFAGRKFLVHVNDPKGEKIYENTYTADEFGGFDGEIPADKLGKDATLGQYSIHIPHLGGGSFRLEEYKKPEFEVKVDAPDEPVMLGEKVTAKVTAKYYFGAPVAEGKATYKVLRNSHSAQWYPWGYWDWFYGRGYWWFAYDYTWYPGWHEWGCPRPTPIWWWQWAPREQPEVVAEGEIDLAAAAKDGTFNIEIDTSLAKAVHGRTDHKYSITVEVTDNSRRTIVGSGEVLVARKPFKVYAWVHRGHYRVGDAVRAEFNAQTLAGKPVQGKGEMRLVKIAYDPAKGSAPVETVVEEWKELPTDVEGRATQQFKAGQPGQYRLVYRVTDAKGHAIEGGYVFTVIGEQFIAKDAGFRFNEIELVTDKKEYKPGEKIDLQINTDQADSTVLLFVRATNGVYLPPQILRLKGKSVREAIEVTRRDMPNFYIEGLTVSKGNVYTEIREVVVPPEDRVLDVKVDVESLSLPGRGQGEGGAKADSPSPGSAVPSHPLPDGEKGRFKPGQTAKVTVKLTDPTGEPFSGSTVIAMYDKAVEYISGGSNVPEIREFFWKWRRHHRPAGDSSLAKGGRNLLKPGEIGMSFLGVFGASVVEELQDISANQQRGQIGGGRGEAEFGQVRRSMALRDGADAPAAPPAPSVAMAPAADAAKAESGAGPTEPEAGPAVEVRSEFADTAFWAGAVTTNEKGEATVEVKMPENLTTWTTKVWAMGHGTRVGQGSTEVITTKDVIVRLQAPRFFVQKDEVVLSANVHNFLKEKKSFKVALEMEGKTLELMGSGKDAVAERTIEIDAGGEKRVDWRVKVLQPGEAIIRVKAICDTDSDAMQMSFPVYIHGMLKMESFSGVIRPDEKRGQVNIRVPAERLPEQSRLEVRYSPTLAGAMVDALPYMVDYPYGCTEQTLNRFLPTVITQNMLMRMGLDLKDIQQKRTNLNAQEIGDDAERAKDWSFRGGYMSRGTAHVRNPVFDQDEVKKMVRAGLERLGAMQVSDGGWGWFSGWGERSWPHTTAVVVHGLQVARANDVAIVPGMLERGIDWLKGYQAQQVQMLQNAASKKQPWKEKADNIDALVYMVLADEAAFRKDAKDLDNVAMRDFLYRDRNDLAVYGKAMFGLALHRVGDFEKRDMLIRNIEQFLVQDDENQSAYLKLPAGTWWWMWYGSEIETQAFYLKLISAKYEQLATRLGILTPEEEAEKKRLLDTASRLVKYLVNNRKHASYWNSTRDTAYVIEAFADYLRASGEEAPDMTVRVLLNGKQVKQVKIDKSNIFSFDNKFVLEGTAVTAGEHRIEIVRDGTGPVYFNAYLTNFTLEDPIKAAGLEIKVDRKFYKLVRVDKSIKAAGDRGQVLDQKVEKYERQEIADGAELKSGDLVEIELTIDSKNDYEYIIFEDMKAAGFEPVEVRSGYNGNDLGAYMELRDERVSFFVRMLPRGQRSVAYRLRAEIPGKFSALPAKGSAMYAPELRANSDEFKIGVTD